MSCAGFASDLERGREARRDRTDPVWCVLRAVAEEHGLTTDPLEEVGVKGPWHRAREPIDTAIRLLVLAAGQTQADAAERMGYSPTRAYNARRPPYLDEDELALLDRAEELHGGPLAYA